MNKFPLLNKTVLIGLLVLLLAIPLTMVQSLVVERTANRNIAAQEVARASAGEQTLVGPVLWVPLTETYPVTVNAPDPLGQVRADPVRGGQTRIEMQERRSAVLIFPAALEVKSQLDTDVRWRGIFPVTVFNSGHHAQGRFVWRPPVAQMKDGQIQLGQPRVLMGVSDARGLLSAPQISVGGKALAFAQAPADANAPLPLAATLSVASLQPDAVLPFELTLDVAGTGRLAFVPLGDENTVTLASSWPHPSFDGRFLPRQRSVSESGFSANWSATSVSSQAQTQFVEMAASKERHTPSVFDRFEQFSVSLKDPVDVYHLTDRATKYGLMFVALTFAAFFVLEMVKRWRIHPMQYLMVGAALVLFFLLLLSLSEHLSFAVAYALASAACIALLSHYLRHVLGSWRAGLGMSGLLVALYGVLYGILISEDNALVMGSLLLFGVLAAVMVATRKIDWYGVMRSESRPASVRPAEAGGGSAFGPFV